MAQMPIQTCLFDGVLSVHAHEARRRDTELSAGLGGGGREGQEILYNFQNPSQAQTRLSFQNSITELSSSWTKGSERLGECVVSATC